MAFKKGRDEFYSFWWRFFLDFLGSLIESFYLKNMYFIFGCTWAFCSCCEQGLLSSCRARASHSGGYSFGGL